MAEVRVQEDNSELVIPLGTTEGGKVINLVRKTNCSIRTIAFNSGGQLPVQLSGGFSSVIAATKAVDSYLAKVKAKVIKVDGSKMPSKKAK